MKLVLVRHGDRIYGEDVLSGFGRCQMESLAAELAKRFTGQRIALLSSSAHRALISAEIIGKALEVTPVAYDLLWSESSRPQKEYEALELIQRHQDSCDVVVVVTHLEYCSALPMVMGWDWNVELRDRQNRDLKNGHALVIDFDQKNCVEIVNDQQSS